MSRKAVVMGMELLGNFGIRLHLGLFSVLFSSNSNTPSPHLRPEVDVQTLQRPAFMLQVKVRPEKMIGNIFPSRSERR